MRGAAGLAASLRAGRAEANLYKVLATLRTDAAIDARPEALAWRGVDGPALTALAPTLGLDLTTVRLPGL